MFSRVILTTAFLDWQFLIARRGLLGHGQCAVLGEGRHNPHLRLAHKRGLSRRKPTVVTSFHGVSVARDVV